MLPTATHPSVRLKELSKHGNTRLGLGFEIPRSRGARQYGDLDFFVSPAVGTAAMVLVTMFPVIFLGAREEDMVGLGWLTYPAAIVTAPAIAAIVTYSLLRLVTSRALTYLVFGALAYWFLLTSTPLARGLGRGGRWLYQWMK